MQDAEKSLNKYSDVSVDFPNKNEKGKKLEIA